MFRQLEFSSALLDPDLPVPHELVAHNARAPARRFAIYRNNVVVGLIDALAARFPVTQRIVGEEFFRAMGQFYVRKHPPCSALMMQYGDGFPEFVATFAPAEQLEYLPDVARLEAARTRAYHAVDAVPLDVDALHLINASKLPAVRFLQHPAAAIVRSAYPIVTIWAMNAGESELAPIENWGGEDAIVLRPGLEVMVRALPAGGASFLAALFSGATLASAAEGALAECCEFDLVANLAGLISSGAVTRVLLPD